MTNEMDAFLNKASKIIKLQSESDRSGAELGFYYCTPREAGVFLDPSTPAYLSQARTFTRFTNTPAGHALWELGSLSTLAKIMAMTGQESELPKPESTFNPSITINRS